MNQFSFPSLFKIVESMGIITALFYSQTILRVSECLGCPPWWENSRHKFPSEFRTLVDDNIESSQE